MKTTIVKEYLVQPMKIEINLDQWQQGVSSLNGNIVFVDRMIDLQTGEDTGQRKVFSVNLKDCDLQDIVLIYEKISNLHDDKFPD